MHRETIDSLRAIVGPRGVIDDASRRTTYECDGLAFVRRTPELVVLPASTEETARCVELLAREGIPVVPRGAGTGLAGGATPVEGGVVIGTARMRRLLELDVENRFARVEAGLVNLDLSREAAKHGLFYAPDPSSQTVCTLGGNVANNAGGPHCIKYGTTTRHVLGLVVVTADGEVLDLSAAEVDPPGYDLVGLFVGSEGTFGLATELTVRLLPLPEVTETMLGLFKTLDDACECVSEIIAERWEPSALEIVDRLTIQAVEASVFAAGYPKEVEAVLLIEADGTALEVEGNVAGMKTILERHGVLDVRRARDELERKKLWAGRKGAYGAMGRIAPDLYVSDVVVPRTRLREVVAKATEICRERDLKLANVFHAGDGNLHPNISYDRRDPEELAKVLEAGERIAELCVEVGGTLSGEHGIGLEKQGQMHLYFTREDLAAMAAVRDAWDPADRMNPGKLLPGVA